MIIPDKILDLMKQIIELKEEEIKDLKEKEEKNYLKKKLMKKEELLIKKRK